MKSIQQRPLECSIASLAILNEMTQGDYEALSDLVASLIPGYKSAPNEHISKAVKIASDLGLTIPPEYLLDKRSNLWPTAAPERFQGKGIAWVRYAPNSHVVAYQDGVFTDSDGKCHQSWEAMRIYARDVLRKRIKLIKVFPL
jgi:hypothetical protein